MHVFFLLRLFCLLAAGASFWLPAAAAPSAPVHTPVSLIPAPRQLSQATGQPGFCLSGGIRVDSATSHSEAGRAAIRALVAAGFNVQPDEVVGDLQVQMAGNLPPGGYLLECTSLGIRLSVGDTAALHAAAQTLAQAATVDEKGAPALPAMKVADHPALHHRGIMLDPCRHPVSVEGIRRILRLMARYKLNRLHWHLCDDQGWCIEIRKYPRLTESECIPDMRKLEFMLVPRICALAEHAWLYGTPNRPPADDFSSRLLQHIPYFDSLQLNFRQEDGSPRHGR